MTPKIIFIGKVINYKINTIYISNKDRLTRLSFRTLKQLFAKYSTQIISEICLTI